MASGRVSPWSVRQGMEATWREMPERVPRSHHRQPWSKIHPSRYPPPGASPRRRSIAARIDVEASLWSPRWTERPGSRAEVLLPTSGAGLRRQRLGPVLSCVYCRPRSDSASSGCAARTQHGLQAGIAGGDLAPSQSTQSKCPTGLEKGSSATLGFAGCWRRRASSGNLGTARAGSGSSGELGAWKPAWESWTAEGGRSAYSGASRPS